MTVFWIIVGVALLGALFLAWRTDHKNRARRIALQGQAPGGIHLNARGNPYGAQNHSGGIPDGGSYPT